MNSRYRTGKVAAVLLFAGAVVAGCAATIDATSIKTAGGVAAVPSKELVTCPVGTVLAGPRTRAKATATRAIRRSRLISNVRASSGEVSNNPRLGVLTSDLAASFSPDSYGRLEKSYCGTEVEKHINVPTFLFPAVRRLSTEASFSRLFASPIKDRCKVWDGYPECLLTQRMKVHALSPSPTSTTATGASAPGTGVASVPPSNAAGPIYLALGDSAPVYDGKASYPDHIAAHYAKTIPSLELVNLAESGATTTSMLQGSGDGAASQQHQAVAFLQAHRGSIALISIDIGGNDILACATRGGTNVRGCLKRVERTMAANLTSILTGLRQAAGPTVPIVGMTYYDPFLGNWLAGGAGRTTAIESVPDLVHLNTVLTATYTKVGAKVANVANNFQSTQLTRTVKSPWGKLPVAVAQACRLLDVTCRAGHAAGIAADPNDVGADVIARAFEQAIGPLKSPV